MWLEILRVYLLESSSNSRIEKLAVRRQEAIPSYLADPIVSEVEALTDPVENSTAHELFEAPCRRTR